MKINMATEFIRVLKEDRKGIGVYREGMSHRSYIYNKINDDKTGLFRYIALFYHTIYKVMIESFINEKALIYKIWILVPGKYKNDILNQTNEQFAYLDNFITFVFPTQDVEKLFLERVYVDCNKGGVYTNDLINTSIRWNRLLVPKGWNKFNYLYEHKIITLSSDDHVKVDGVKLLYTRIVHKQIDPNRLNYGDIIFITDFDWLNGGINKGLYQVAESEGSSDMILNYYYPYLSIPENMDIKPKLSMPGSVSATGVRFILYMPPHTLYMLNRAKDLTGNDPTTSGVGKRRIRFS